MGLFENLTKRWALFQRKTHTGPLCVPPLEFRDAPQALHRQQLEHGRLSAHWRVLRSAASHRPGCPAHLNEQAGESGGQLSSSRLNVMLHEEAHAPDPAHCNGDLRKEGRARQGGIWLLPRDSRARHDPIPQESPGPWLCTTSCPPPSPLHI